MRYNYFRRFHLVIIPSLLMILYSGCGYKGDPTYLPPAAKETSGKK